ncbi:hypothetical protein, partial [Cernens ardua]|uniref:hypothetical protein n=1 Tax=Cernens ardua TaxID=3402176 RepID=UPI003F965828
MTTKPRKKKHHTKRKDPFTESMEAWAAGYYRIRFDNEEDETSSFEDNGFLKPWPPTRRVLPCNDEMAYYAEQHAVIKKRRWRAVLITYMRDNNCNEYRNIVAGESVQPFTAYKEGIVPFLTRLCDENEKKINKRHLFARAAVMTPMGHYGIENILPKYQKELMLTNGELEAVSQLLNEEPEVTTFNTFDDLDIDQKISWLAHEEYMASR